MELIAHRTGPSRSKTTYYLLLVGLFVGSILIFSSWLNLYRAVGQRQLQERVVERRADFVPPVTILSAKAKRGEFRFGEKVLDDDDWFKGLTVEVHNESLKTVIYVGVEVTFRRPDKDSKEPPASWQLEYGDDPFRYKTQEAIPPLRVKPVSPGETVEINLSYQNFDDIKLFLKSAKYSLSPKSIELRVTDIGFDDGSAWHAGRFLRRDANNSWGWSPVNSENPEVEHRKGSAGKSTVNFLRVEVNNSVEVSWRESAKISALAPDGCGDIFPSFVECPPQPSECKFRKDNLTCRQSGRQYGPRYSTKSASARSVTSSQT